MPIPPRAKQTEWLAAQIDKGAENEESLTSFARRIVDGFHEMLTQGLKDGTPPLHEGAVFKSPFTTKVHLVAWMDGEKAWVVSADCRFGSFASIDDPFWKYTEYTRSNPDLLRKNEEYKVGDIVSRSQRYYHGKVIAVGNKCVLLECLQTGNIQPDSNENLKRYYVKVRGSK